MEKYDISVVVATRNRAEMLPRLLETLQRQQLAGATLQVVIVNNGSTDNTELVLARDWNLDIIVLQEPVAGKSRALNRALLHVSGDLVVFTDDDITAPAEWLLSLLRAQQRHPSATVFCGPINPEFPPGTPAWLQHHPVGGPLFGQFICDQPEGFLPPGINPFGANFAVQSSVLKTLRFQLELGPSQENGAMMGEDTDFVLRLRAQGENILYVPDALVKHWIQQSQIEFSSLFTRAFHLGRSRIAIHKTPRSDVAAFWRQTESLEPPEAREFTRGFILNYCCGQIHQSTADGNAGIRCDMASLLPDIELPAYVNLLVPAARQTLVRRPAESSAG